MIMNKHFKMWPTIASISTKQTITEKVSPLTNLQWIHSKSKDCKRNN